MKEQEEDEEIQEESFEIREIEVVFVKEHKFFIKKYSKKSKNDYMLNINKLVKDKLSSKFIVPNKIQAFILNYEIKKLLDKAINIKNNKYDRIIYMNSDLSISGISNTVEFLNREYEFVNFSYHLIDTKDDFEDAEIERLRNVTLSR